MSGKTAKEQRVRDELVLARREVFEVRALNDMLADERDGLLEQVDQLKSFLRKADAEGISKDLGGRDARHGPDANWLCKLSRVVLEMDEACAEDGDTGEAMLPMEGWEELVNLARVVQSALHPKERESAQNKDEP